MKPQAKIGAAMVAAGLAVYALTPSHVTWGNHHYVKHFLAGALVTIGALFLIVGSRN